MAKRKTQTESIITKQVVEYLESKGCIVKKVYNGGVPGGVTKGKIRYKSKPKNEKGIPDLIAIHLKKKVFLFIEMKSKNGKVSEEQEEFINLFNRCKQHCAVVCRSVEDVKKIL